MAVRVGLVLSAIVVVAAFAYIAFGPDDRYPDLAYIYVYLASIGAAVALAVIWLGVFVAILVKGKRKR
jgi:hypothetical protein